VLQPCGGQHGVGASLLLLGLLLLLRQRRHLPVGHSSSEHVC
jgi:uncharacterized protein (TIGR03382 family)